MATLGGLGQLRNIGPQTKGPQRGTRKKDKKLQRRTPPGRPEQIITDPIVPTVPPISQALGVADVNAEEDTLLKKKKKKNVTGSPAPTAVLGAAGGSQAASRVLDL